MQRRECLVASSTDLFSACAILGRGFGATRQDACPRGGGDRAVRILSRQKSLADKCLGGMADDADVTFLGAVTFFERQSRIVGLEPLRFGCRKRNVSAGE